MLYYLKARAVIEQAAQQEGRDPASLRDLRALLEQSYAFAPEEQRRAMPEELREVAGARGSRAARGGHPSPSPSTSMRTCGSSCWRRTRRQRRRRPRPRWKRARRGCGCGCGSWCRGSSLDPLFTGGGGAFTTSDQILIHKQASKRACFRNRFLSPFGKTRQCLDGVGGWVHLALIVYSAVALPFLVGFRVPLGPALVALKLLVLVEIVGYVRTLHSACARPSSSAAASLATSARSSRATRRTASVRRALRRACVACGLLAAITMNRSRQSEPRRPVSSSRR